MGVLHQVWLAAADERWALLASALAAGDVVVLLGPAVADPPACAARLHALHARGVRWCALAIDLAESVPGVERIDDAQWWALIEARPELLEWA